MFIANAREGHPIKRLNQDWVRVAPLKGEVTSLKSMTQVKLGIKKQDYYPVHMSCMSLKRPAYAKANLGLPCGIGDPIICMGSVTHAGGLAISLRIALQRIA